MRGIDRLKAGDFNSMIQENNPDGSVTVTLVKRGDKTAARFRVRNLYGPAEEILEENEIEAAAAVSQIDFNVSQNGGRHE